VENGFAGATMAAIARRAGVATQTVYFVFHTKPELISAVIDTAVMGEDEPLPPQSTEWWQAMVAEPDVVEALRTFLRGVGPVFARAATISEVLRAAALTDPEVRRTHEMHEGMRRIGFGQVLDVLEAKAPLRADRTREQLLATFLTVCGDAVYHLYAVEQGWSHDDIVEWWCAELPALLLAP
jgi:AcrR family transcriptional regulator